MLVFFACCCAGTDATVREIGLLPTYTPTATRTPRPTPTITPTPEPSPTPTPNVGSWNWFSLACEKRIRRELLSPDSAEFPWASDYIRRLDNGVWRYAGWVKAKNAFGVTLTYNFVCEAKHHAPGSQVGGDGYYEITRLDMAPGDEF